MDDRTETQFVHLIWIDEANKVISFRRAEGFHILSFPSRDTMLAYVFELGMTGYRIQ